MIYKVLKYTAIALISWFVIHTIVVLTDGFNDDDHPADVGVIFGNTVFPDGSLSPRLQARLDKGIEIFQKGQTNLLIVSGGLGKEGHYEGTKMFEYLLLKGIPQDKIVIDNEGNTTDATARNVSRMQVNFRSVIVVTQYHHVSRAKLAFRKMGFEQVYGVHATFFEPRDVYSIVREFFGFYKYLLVM